MEHFELPCFFKKGFKADNMKTWKMHWDRQLYKTLDHQYQMGLEALNENLPEIKVELVFRLVDIQNPKPSDPMTKPFTPGSDS